MKLTDGPGVFFSFFFLYIDLSFNLSSCRFDVTGHQVPIVFDQDSEEGDEDGTSSLTELLAHEPGWTIFEKLYLYAGSLYVVTNDPHVYPDMRLMTSTGLPANSDPGNEQAREPTGEELKFISPVEAEELWGDRVWRMDGMTWLFNDGQCEFEAFEPATIIPC